MKKDQLRIGLALSGGGMRAAIFHLGVLKFLAEVGLMKQVVHISTVSGASIAIGLMYAKNDYAWPSDLQYLTKVLPDIRKVLTEKDIQWAALRRLVISPYYWNKKVNLLAKVMEKKWDIHASIQDIPRSPLWTINTTAYETGKDFRISNRRMGAGTSYVQRPNLRLSHAMGASAGFPVWIGPYKLKTSDYAWSDRSATINVRPKDKRLHLWDGGVYDNMGLDPLFQFKGDNRLRDPINFLIVSHASADFLEHRTRGFGYSLGNLKRLLDISMQQSQGLRKREVLDVIEHQHNGMFLQIGVGAASLVKQSALTFTQKQKVIHNSLKEHEVSQIAAYKTTLEKVSLRDFDRILRHGYETARIQAICCGHLS